MTTYRAVRILLAGLFCLCVAPGVQAQSTKPGLWEIDSNTRVDGQAMPDMAAMMKDVPPQMRKQMEAMMAQQGVGMAPRGMRICVTPEQAVRDELPLRQEDGCKTRWQQRSGKRLSFSMECSDPPAKGEGEVELISPEAWTSRMTMRIQEGRQTHEVRSETRGKWLSAQCGKIRPAPSTASHR